MMPENVPVVEINRNNLNKLWPSLLIAIRRAQLISIDLELSGLGERAGLTAKSFEDRYEHIRNATQTRSILSIGISLFELKEIVESKKRITYNCQVFNLLVWSETNFTVEPEALIFLAGHEFDFNKLIKSGIRYSRKNSDTLHILLEEILSSGVNLCFHNGLIDLMFIYHHLYDDLPANSAEFIANISDWFSSIEGKEKPLLLDSKYIAEYSEKTSASFLEYIFRKYQRTNFDEFRSGRVYFDIEFSTNAFILEYTEWIDCKLPANVMNKEFFIDKAEELCQSFSNHGYCHKRINGKCIKIHDVDLVLDVEEIKIKKERERRKRKYKDIKYIDCSINLSPSIIEKCPITKKDKISVRGSHRAGMDSFMTGFSILFPQRMSLYRTKEFDAKFDGKLPLSGKKFPLHIHKSAYANQSEKHLQKWARIQSKRLND